MPRFGSRAEIETGENVCSDTAPERPSPWRAWRQPALSDGSTACLSPAGIGARTSRSRPWGSSTDSPPSATDAPTPAPLPWRAGAACTPARSSHGAGPNRRVVSR